MAASTTVNGRTVVHRKSAGALATFPDVCLTPTPGGPVPIPYPNLARSADLTGGAETVTVDGCPVAVQDSVFSRSTGDEPGTQKGVISQAQGGEARFLNWSFDVKVEGKGVCRLLDPMASNGGSPTNTPPAGEVQPPLVVPPVAFPDLPEVHTLGIEFKYSTDLKRDVTTPVPAELATDYTVQSVSGTRIEHSPVTGLDGVYSTGYMLVMEDGHYSLAFDAWTLRQLPLKDPARSRKVARYVVSSAQAASARFAATRDRVRDDRRSDETSRFIGWSPSTDREALDDLVGHLDTAKDELDAVRNTLAGFGVGDKRLWKLLAPTPDEAREAHGHLVAAVAALDAADAVAARLAAQARHHALHPDPDSPFAEVFRDIDDLRESLGHAPLGPSAEAEARAARYAEPWERTRREAADVRAEALSLAHYLDYEIASAP